jgi:hypothetical protein
MRKAVLLLPLVAALAMSACSKGPEEKLPEDNSVVVENATENANVAVAPPANTTETAKAAPAPGFTDDQQMHDDADATGMTARLPDESTPQPGNGIAPVR